MAHLQRFAACLLDAGIPAPFKGVLGDEEALRELAVADRDEVIAVLKAAGISKVGLRIKLEQALRERPGENNASLAPIALAEEFSEAELPPPPPPKPKPLPSSSAPAPSAAAYPELPPTAHPHGATAEWCIRCRCRPAYCKADEEAEPARQQQILAAVGRTRRSVLASRWRSAPQFGHRRCTKCAARWQFERAWE